MMEKTENNKFTEFTRTHWDAISQENLSPEAAVAFFESEFIPRTFSDILKSFYNGDDLVGDLSEKLNAYDNYLHRFENKEGVLNIDGTEHKIRNWLSGNNTPKRIDLIKICFALGFDGKTSENESLKKIDKNPDNLMKYDSEGIFHVREPIEAVFLWFLKNGGTFEEAHKFIMDNSIKLYEFNDSAQVDEEADFTKLVRYDFEKVTADSQSFFDFLEKNKSRFGSLHNRAYKNFRDYYMYLANPKDPLFDAATVTGTERGKNSIFEKEKILNGREKYKELYGEENLSDYGEKSCAAIVDEYLWLGLDIKLEYKLKQNKNTDENKLKLEKYNEMQKMIGYLTGEKTIGSMMRRKRDITRKILLLLYVMTQGMTNDIHEYEDINADLKPSEIMEEHASRINDMLYESGFGELDPRNKFDWLILYSLKVSLNENEILEVDNPLFERFKSIFEEAQRKVIKIADPVSAETAKKSDESDNNDNEDEKNKKRKRSE